MSSLRFKGVLATVGGLGLAACVSATPVTPAPLEPAEEAKLTAALLGPCTVTTVEKEGRVTESDPGIAFVFGPNGSMHLNLGHFDHEYAYSLSGRNIHTDAPWKDLRVEDWSGEKLRLFVYDTSQTFTCAKAKP